MAPKEFLTADAEAFSSFVQGRALFQEYLGNGSGEELNEARDHFATATARDPEFDIAKLYLAVTQTELRDSAEAIPALQQLIQKGRFLPEAHLQLAYAYTKRYREVDYPAAAAELDQADHAARTGNRDDLIDLIKAYRVFLLAVRGGREKGLPPEKRAEYLDEAVTLGTDLLKCALTVESRQQRLAVQFEVHNAIGIALLRLGELCEQGFARLLQTKRTDDKNAPPLKHSSVVDSDPPSTSRYWQESENNFREALALRPRSVRVLQNLALLYLDRGDRAQEESRKSRHEGGQKASLEARRFYEAAIDFVTQSIKLNPFDQYPHYQLASLSIKLGDWEAARKSFESGLAQKGAVPAESWAKIKDAIESRDASKIAKSS
jgi:tetratricopeptide (TPR) repeat protein